MACNNNITHDYWQFVHAQLQSYMYNRAGANAKGTHLIRESTDSLIKLNVSTQWAFGVTIWELSLVVESPILEFQS